MLSSTLSGVQLVSTHVEVASTMQPATERAASLIGIDVKITRMC